MSVLLARANATAVPVFDPAYLNESNTARWLGVTGTFTFLALILTCLRVYARPYLTKSFGYDDGFMVSATATGVITWGIFAAQAPIGLGRHYDTLSAVNKIEFNRLGFIQSLLATIIGMAFLKISIALTLKRLCQVINPWYTRSLWALIAFVVSYTVLAVITFLFKCQPMSGYWDPGQIPAPKCYSIKMFIEFGVTNTAFNIFTDVAFATLPIPIVWSLQMRLRTRVYLVIILSLGYFAVALGVVKAIYQIKYGATPDRSFESSTNFYGHLQFCVGVMAACAASLKPLVGRLLNLDDSNAMTRPSFVKTISGNRTWGSSSAGSATRPAGSRGYVRTSDLELGHVNEDRRAGHRPTDRIYDAAERSGSEDLIIQGKGEFLGRDMDGAIVRTKVISVKSEGRR